MCHELAFFMFFSPLFLRLTIIISPQFLSYLAIHIHFNPFCLLTLFQKTNIHCIESHNIADSNIQTTTEGLFQDKMKHKLSNCLEEQQDQ